MPTQGPSRKSTREKSGLAGLGASQVHLVDVATGRSKRAFPEKTYKGLAFSPDGRALACGDATGISVWELASGQERCRIEMAVTGGWILRFSPDGRWLAGSTYAGVVHLWDALRGVLVQTFQEHDGPVETLAFAPDGRTLASASYDSTILVWDVVGVAAQQPASRQQPDAAVLAAWDDLGSADAKAAFRALRILVEAPHQSLRILQERLRPAPRPGAKQIEGWLADLDSASFAARERATRELERLGDQAEAALRRFLDGNPSAEARRRAEELLTRAEGPITDPKRLQQLRALEVLEAVGNAEARQLLQRLAEGGPDVRLTLDARAVLDRLRRRGPP
jgi:hypothetical protein